MRFILREMTEGSYKDFLLTKIAVFICFIGAFHFSDVAINNGDWYRVTQFAGFAPPPWKPGEGSYELTGEPNLSHSTTMAILVALISHVGAIFNFNTFSAKATSLILFVLYSLGALIIATDKTIKGKIFILAALFFLLLSYGFLFKSFYEEAAVMAAVPLFIAGAHMLLHERRWLLFTISSCMVVYGKAQMIYLAPIALVLMISVFRQNKTMRPISFLVLFIAVCAAASQSRHVDNKAPNQFNRFYNGLGWTELNSRLWPGSTFNDRHHYFYKNLNEQRRLETGDPILRLMGTSYWPTGSELAKEAWGPTTPPEQAEALRAQFSNILSRGELQNYFMHLVEHPRLVANFIVNSFAMAWSSDYSLAYIRKDDSDRIFESKYAEEAGLLISRNLGKTILISALLGLCLVKALWAKSTFALFLLAPLSVAVGDGFYEYEKHLVSFFIFVPYLFYLFSNSGNVLSRLQRS